MTARTTSGRRWRVAALAAAMVALTGACAADGGVTDAGEAVSATSGMATQAGLALVGGGRIDLDATIAEGPVALWFWAPG